MHNLFKQIRMIAYVTWHEKTLLMCTQNLTTFLEFKFQ